MREQAVRAFVTENEIDVIVNCAAYTAVDNAEDNRELCDKLNHVLRDIWRVPRKAVVPPLYRFLRITFSMEQLTSLNNEDEPTCPASVYGFTKLAGEQAVAEGCEKAVIIRTAWLYSIYGNNFVKTMMRLGRERDNLGVVFDQVGTPT